MRMAELSLVLEFFRLSLYGAQALDPVLFGSDGGCVGSVLRDVVLSDVTWVVIIPFQSGRPG